MTAIELRDRLALGGKNDFEMIYQPHRITLDIHLRPHSEKARLVARVLQRLQNFSLGVFATPKTQVLILTQRQITGYGRTKRRELPSQALRCLLPCVK